MSLKIGDIVLVDNAIMVVVAVNESGCDMVQPPTMELHMNVTSWRLLPDEIVGGVECFIHQSIWMLTQSLQKLSAAMEARNNSQ